MNDRLRAKVMTIAIGVRNWAQDLAEEQNYNAEDLLGWCAIASAELHKRLKSFGVKSTICMSNVSGAGYHCFVMVEDHIVDVTATQFKAFYADPVVIMHSKEAECNDYHVPMIEFSTCQALRKYQKKTDWPSYQICYA